MLRLGLPRGPGAIALGAVGPAACRVAPISRGGFLFAGRVDRDVLSGVTGASVGWLSGLLGMVFKGPKQSLIVELPP